MGERSLKYKILSLMLFALLPSALLAEHPDDLYREGKYAEAEKGYRQADMDNPRDIRYRYNRGCAAFQNSDYKGAAAAFTSVLRRSKDREMLYKASYNLGNTAFSQGDFATAAEFYKQSLVHNPGSMDARYNLELSLKKLKESKNDKNKKDNSKENNDKKDKDKKEKDKESGDRDKQSGEGQKDDQKNDEKKDLSGDMTGPENDEKQKAENAAAVLDRQKAEALLDNIKEDRAKIMQFQAPEAKENTKTGKNW